MSVLSYSHAYSGPSIEDIRLQKYSCLTCGVSWLEDHVCLDCEECGGYSLQRPCLQCEGQCPALWQRDLTLSHACGRARWVGSCLLQSPATAEPGTQSRRVSDHSDTQLITSSHSTV